MLRKCPEAARSVALAANGSRRGSAAAALRLPAQQRGRSPAAGSFTAAAAAGSDLVGPRERAKVAERAHARAWLQARQQEPAVTPDDAAAITALFTSVSEAEQADRASQAATEVTEEQQTLKS